MTLVTLFKLKRKLNRKANHELQRRTFSREFSITFVLKPHIYFDDSKPRSSAQERGVIKLPHVNVSPSTETQAAGGAPSLQQDPTPPLLPASVRGCRLWAPAQEP